MGHPSSQGLTEGEISRAYVAVCGVCATRHTHAAQNQKQMAEAMRSMKWKQTTQLKGQGRDWICPKHYDGEEAETRGSYTIYDDLTRGKEKAEVIQRPSQD